MLSCYVNSGATAAGAAAPSVLSRPMQRKLVTLVHLHDLSVLI